MEAWRISFLPSPETFHVQSAPLLPLLAKELWEILSGRALWTVLLLMCPLVGCSFFQAVSLYGEASTAGLQSPVLANSLSPLDGILVPTLGASYVAITLLFPFVAIRVLGLEKESGALRLLVQMPYRSSSLITAKLAAVLAAWVLSSVPALSALAIWRLFGGHLSAPETLNLLFGHLLYGLLVGAIALFAASVSESAATAAIVTLAFTIGSWVLDFTVAGHPGLLEWVASLSLTQVLRTFEQGLLSVGLVVGIGTAVCGFAALANVWLPPGIHARNKLVRSIVCVLVAAIALGLATQIRLSIDVTEDQRNSFPVADQRVLVKLAEPLVVTVIWRRKTPDTRICSATCWRSWNGCYRTCQSVWRAGGKASQPMPATIATSPREILPLLYGLAGVSRPAPAPGSDYPGYPLVARGEFALLWFLGGLPLCIAFVWWRSRRLPTNSRKLRKEAQP